MKSAKLITHNGKAHFDEFLAVALILAEHDDTHFHIERREPTEEELDNPDIWIVDIGQRYQPELKNFDHHQDTSLKASFVLVAEHLQVDQYLRNAPWWSFKDEIDRRGGYKLADELGLESLEPLNSPLENFILGLFAESPLSVYQQMKMFGRDQIETGKKMEQQIEFWKTCEQFMIKDKKVLLGLTDETMGSVEYCESLDEPPAVRITYDGRGEGWSLSTIKDAEGVDFSLLEGHEEIKFAHKNGFIAKTKKRIALEDVKKLVEKAIVNGHS